MTPLFSKITINRHFSITTDAITPFKLLSTEPVLLFSVYRFVVLIYPGRTMPSELVKVFVTLQRHFL